MAQIPHVVELIPMRHHSERVLGKNYRPLLGRLLDAYILTTLMDRPEIYQIVVDTDSPIILRRSVKRIPRHALDRSTGEFAR